jgi:protocatechuate 3,4-dioxygenase beta subunit
LAAACWGQSGTGDLGGTVLDSSGAAVAGATVTISNPATGFNRVLRTNEGGIYAAPALSPGAYTVKVEKEGFQSQSRAGGELMAGRLRR